MKIKNTWKKVIIILFLLICITSVFYYSWLPNPGLETETYLPDWIIKWSDKYYNLRTAIPFVVLGYLLELWELLSKTSSSHIKRTFFRFKNLMITTLVVCLAEGGQFFIMARNPDFMDVLFGILGGILGCCIFHINQKINLLFFNKNA